MKKVLMTVALGGALALGSLSLYAHGEEGRAPGGPGRGMHGNPLEHLTKDLNLTADQQAKVAPILTQARPQLEAIHQEARQKAQGVMESTAAQIRPLLTAEQQARFDAIKKAHQDMMNARQELHEAKSQ